MTKFKYEFTSAEQTVITVNVIKSVTINGQLIPIGAHLVTFSGRAQLSFADPNADEDDQLARMVYQKLTLGYS